MSNGDRRQKLRHAPPAEVPLDDGPRFGPEPRREVDGVRFCHWDRWLLRLAVTEPDGLASLEREFRRRAQAGRPRDSTAEALGAQVVDLRARLGRLGRAPEAVLDEEERSSEWLRAKAFRRVWHASSVRQTEAMRRTPRAVLSDRALRGNWAVFAVSPAPYAHQLESVIGGRCYDSRESGTAITLLQVSASGLIFAARADAERMAIHRAVLTVVIEAMERIDDSSGEMAELFREHESAYLELLIGCNDARPLLGDLLEIVIWEDYGLFAGFPGFVRKLTEPHADCAMRELGRITAELRREGLRYQVEGAQRMRRALIAAAVDTFLRPDSTVPGA